MIFSVQTAQKMKFFIKDLVTFTGKNLNEKLHFLCSASSSPRNEHFLYIAG